MPTRLIKVFHLGTFGDIDTNESNSQTESAASFVGQTYGSASNPLSSSIDELTLDDADGNGVILDDENGATSDSLIFEGTSAALDSTQSYNVTLTYTDGTSATSVIVLVQDTDGRVFLIPFQEGDSIDDALEAKPIASMRLDSIGVDDAAGINHNINTDAFISAEVDGTSGDDTIGASFVDNDGTQVDGTDGNDDTIFAGGGADSVSAGLGDDTVYGGDGNDTIIGGSGSDLLTGGDANDSIAGGSGVDTIYGGTGNDTLNDGAGSDTIYGGSGDDILVETNADSAGDDLFYGGTGDDQIDISNGGDTAFGGDGSDTFQSLGSSRDKTVTGGEGGTDGDLLSWSGESDAADALNISFSGNEAGSALIRGQTVTFTEIERLEGTQSDDTFNAINDTVGVSVDGQAGDDQFFGGDGNDQFTGGLGNDSIVGDSGNDLVYGGAGADSVDAGSDSDTVFGGANADTLDGGGGADEIYGGEGADFTNGGTGSDTVYAGAGNDDVFGFTGNDTVFAGAGQDFIEAEGGTDTIYAGDDQDTVQIAIGAGTDTVYGGEGGADADTLDLSALGSRVDVDLTGNGAGTASDGINTANFFEFEQFVLTSGNDSVDARGTTAGITVDAGAGNDNFRSESGNDVFFGGDGRDGFGVFGGAGGFGTDSMDGGAGSDDLSFSDTGGLTLSFTSGAGGIVTDGADTVTFTSVEEFDADDGDSFWDFSLASFGVQLVDFSGNDSVIGSAFDDSIFDFSGSSSTGTITVDAGAGDDFVEGSFNSDSISGGTGDDIVNALRGADLVYGGAGNDEITSDGGDSTLYGGSGNDTLDMSFGVADDTLFAGSGNDTLIAGAGNDSIFAGTGDDLVYAGDGADRIVIEDGFAADTIYGGDSGTDIDTLDLTALGTGVTLTFTGDEQGTFSDGTDTGIFFGIENVLLTDQNDHFDASDDTVGVSVDGGAGNDILSGGSGNDALYGGSGSETLDGGAGDDALHGGDDADTFVIDEGNGTDAIYGGEGGADSDTLDFSAISSASNPNITFTGGQQGTFTAGTHSGSFDGIETFILNAGANTFDATGETAGITVFGGAGGRDTITGGEAGDLIYGVTGERQDLDGGNGSDTLYGSTERDDFFLSAGNDTVFGGGQFDDLHVDGSLGSLTVTWTDSGDFTATTGSGTTTFNADDGGVFLIGGSASNDVFDGSGSAGRIVLQDFEGGSDIATGSDFQDFIDLFGRSVTPGEVSTIFAGDGDDFIAAELREAILYGGDGEDNVSSFGGGDTTLYGGIGNDDVFGGIDDQTLYGGLGNDQLDGFTGNDTAFGGSGEDTLYGGAGNDIVGGFGTDNGNDTMFGGTGVDSVFGGVGNDTVYGGDGNDVLSGGSSDDVVYGGEGSDSFLVDHGHEANTIFGGSTGSNIDQLQLVGDSDDGGFSVTLTGDNTGTFAANTDNATGAFADIEQIKVTDDDDFIDASLSSADLDLDADAGDDSVLGGTGDELIHGDAGNDTLAGGAGDDLIYGGTGNDSLTTGTGNDTLFGGAGEDNLANSTGDDTLFGGTGNDTITASAGNDLLYGGTGNDDLYGGIDNDTLYGGSGTEALYGGTGNDLLYAGDDQDTIHVEDGFGTDTVYGGEGGPDLDTLDLTALGTGITVTFTSDEQGTFTDGTDTGTFIGIEDIILTDQDDVLDASNDTVGMTVDGRAGNDTLAGGDGDDALYGGAGNDVLNEALTGLSDDTLYGGTGDDTLDGNGGEDTLYGGSGDDTIDIGNNADTAFGGDDADTIVSEGSAFNKTVFGGEGGDDRDTLSWATEADAADAVDVTFSGDEAGSALIRGQTVTFSEIEAIEGTQVDDTIDASASTVSQTLTGLGGNDTLEGGIGADSIDGGVGNDQLSGGSGNDTLTGGTGDDTFALSSNGGDDTVTDFATGDQIVSSALTDASNVLTNQDGTVTADEVTVTGGGGSDQVLTFPNGETLTVPDGTVDQTNPQTQFASLVAMGVPPCFAPGTCILTYNGEKAVEDLWPGDRIITADRGPQVLRWIGRREVVFETTNPRGDKDKPI